jgi:hypothetical protein
VRQFLKSGVRCEHIDGGTMYSIMAAAEQWPASPWLEPWQPTGDQVMP